jgi:hypothetical protein
MYYVLCIIGDLKGKEYKEIPPLKGGKGDVKTMKYEKICNEKQGE